MHRGRLTTTRIHNKMDQSSQIMINNSLPPFTMYGNIYISVTYFYFFTFTFYLHNQFH